MLGDECGPLLSLCLLAAPFHSFSLSSPLPCSQPVGLQQVGVLLMPQPTSHSREGHETGACPVGIMVWTLVPIIRKGLPSFLLGLLNLSNEN